MSLSTEAPVEKLVVKRQLVLAAVCVATVSGYGCSLLVDTSDFAGPDEVTALAPDAAPAPPKDAGTNGPTMTTITTSAYERAVLADAPVAYFRLEETDGRDLVNGARGSAVTGKMFGASTRASSGAFANSRSVALPGTAGGIQVENLPTSSGKTEYTIEMWLLLANEPTSQNELIFDRDFGMLYGETYLSYSTGGLEFVRRAGNNLRSTTLTSLPPIRTWHHLVCTYADNFLTVYVDAQAERTDQFHVAFDPALPEADLTIGGRSAGSTTEYPSLVGSIDEIGVYTKALGASAVATHFAEAGRP